MAISPNERTCRKAITFLLNHTNPTGWPLARLEQYARLLDALPSSYQVKARTEQATVVAGLIQHRRITALCGVEGQQVFPGEGDGFDDVRAEVAALTNPGSPSSFRVERVS